MSNRNGSLEVNSSSILGAIGTVYPGAAFAARGLESNDHYAVSGNQITVKMSVTEPGDWIRVVTASKSVPDGGATFCLFGLGLAAIGLARRR